MNDNVHIDVRRRGKLVEQRQGHNVWVTRGDTFLASLITLLSFPATPERNDRLRYMGVGIGGTRQNSGPAFTAPLASSYPVGADPQATNGHSYDKDYPINPRITTLERPVRVRGGTNSYSEAPNTDTWLIQAPSMYTTHPSPWSVCLHGTLDGAAGDVAYGPFTTVPLSEIGLFTDELAVSVYQPFSPLMAYFSFDTITFDSDTVVTFHWTVRF